MTVYKSIDVLKLFFAMCVVTIHIECFISEQYPSMVEWVLKLAVPFFFIVTGFLLHSGSKKMDSVSNYIFSKSKHAAVLFVMWIILYLPIDIYELARLGRFNIDGISRYLYHLLTYGEGYYSWPMWYLYSLSIGLLMMALAIRIKYGLRYLFIGLIVILYQPCLGSVSSGIINHLYSTGNLLSFRVLWGGYS